MMRSRHFLRTCTGPPCSRAAIHCCWRASAPPGIYASNTFRWACRGRAGGTLRTFATIALPADSRTLRFYSRHEGVSHQTELRRLLQLRVLRLGSVRMGMSRSAVLLSTSLLPSADTRWLLRRSQQDQDCTDASKHSRSDQQTLALVWKVNCHDRHDGGMSNIQPRGEDDHRAIH